MDIILIPGLWLDGATWSAVAAPLGWAGHDVHALTLPGMESVDADRSGVALDDHVGAVVDAIDSIDPNREIMVVGHSAGSAIAHAAVDRRPDRVARVVHVGGFPTPDGEMIGGGFPTDGADVPLPEWSAFDEADLGGLDEGALAQFRAQAIPSPAGVTGATQTLGDDRRFDVPVTLICPEYRSSMLREWVADEMAPVSEISRIHDVTYADLPTGHWPQFTRPYDLARLLDSCTRQRPGDIIDDDGRIEPPDAGDEAENLFGFLEYQRSTFAWKCIGPDADGMNATVGVSTMTLGGLVKHMAIVEDWWFSCSLHGHEYHDAWRDVGWESQPDWEWESAVDDTPAELATMWYDRVRRSRELTAEAMGDSGLDTLAKRSGSRGTVSLRWIVAHMIEEYARHNGHADLIRETVDGSTGE